jgi:methylated-DNA-[protein]-cysteine S-methyltransferase
MDYFEYIMSPMGPVKIHANDEAVTQCYFCGDSDETLKYYFRSVPAETGNPVTHEAARQLTEYFEGRRKSFTLPLAPSGTWFQRMVWEGLQAIPYGEIRTYGELAHWIGHEKAFRAVGQANGKNPIGIIIPCHRVVAAHGKLGGYTGGLKYKEFLLTLEGTRDWVE